MKKLILIVLSLLLVSCHETYNVITDDNLTESKINVSAIANDYGYTINLINKEDSIIYCTKNSVLNHGYWTIEHYDLVSDNDSFQVDLKYRNRCITEARTIPYYDMVSVGCNGSTDLCDTIRNIFENTPKTNMNVMNEGSVSCLIIGAAMLPFIMLLGYAAIFNTK